MKIPFLDLKAGYLELQPEIDAAIKRVLNSGWYILGSEIEAFEAEFASYCEANYCIGVANGLDALHLSLLALGVKSGDEVIVPSNTYIATWLAVSQCGATPGPVEPDARTYNIDPKAAAAAVGPKSKAVIPVDLFGQMAAIEEIGALIPTLPIIEDAAQSSGASRMIGGKKVMAGEAATIGTFSFFPSKNLGGYGDGGMIVTQDEALALEIVEAVVAWLNTALIVPA